MRYLLRRFVAWFVIALLLLTALWGCTNGRVINANRFGITDRTEERIVLGTTSKIRTLDPADTTGYRDWETDRKSTRLNSSHLKLARMPSSA